MEAKNRNRKKEVINLYFLITNNFHGLQTAIVSHLNVQVGSLRVCNTEIYKKNGSAENRNRKNQAITLSFLITNNFHGLKTVIVINLNVQVGSLSAEYRNRKNKVISLSFLITNNFHGLKTVIVINLNVQVGSLQDCKAEIYKQHGSAENRNRKYEVINLSFLITNNFHGLQTVIVIHLNVQVGSLIVCKVESCKQNGSAKNRNRKKEVINLSFLITNNFDGLQTAIVVHLNVPVGSLRVCKEEIYKQNSSAENRNKK
jgi:hypothetical protein